MPVTFPHRHGRDPRAAKPRGRRRHHYVAHALVQRSSRSPRYAHRACSKRFPKNQIRGDRERYRMGSVGTRRDGRGLHQASHVAYPKLKCCRASIFARTGAVAFQEDARDSASARNSASSIISCGRMTIRINEGSWPHSAQAIERQMGTPQRGPSAAENSRTQRCAHVQISRGREPVSRTA